jgi:hypothetical protein
VRAGTCSAQHRLEHLDRAPDGGAIAADAQQLAFDADDDGDERFERSDVAIVVAVKAQVVVETVERKRRFRRDVGQRANSLTG